MKSVIRPLRALVPLLAAFILAITWLMPLMVGRTEALGQILNRSLTISSGVPSATPTTYSFSFTLASTSNVQGLKFIACTNAIGTYPSGTCTPPTGMTGASGLGNGFWNASFGSQTGFANNTNHFAVDATGAHDCVPAANILCLNRTEPTGEGATAHSVVIANVKNPSASNTAFYVGIYTYSDNTYTTASRIDFGATASAVVQTLTTAAAVAEVLNFCVGSTTVDGVDPASPSNDLPSDCTGVSGTSINIGTLDSSTVNISPVTTDGGDGNNAVAMVRSNAGNGTVVAYDAIQQSGTNHRGTLRIVGDTCSTPGNTFTDPCINSSGVQTPFIPGSENFGMTVAGINSTSTTSYSCSYGVPSAGNSCDLQPLTGYIGNGTNNTDEVYGNSNGFAWNESGSAVNIASSGSSSVKQIDDEALIMKFAATPSITTPFGQYQAQMDMIAVPTY